MRDARFANFGEARLREVVRLVGEGYPDVTSINERLAVNAELEALREEGQATWDLRAPQEAERYALRHLVTSFARTGAERRLTETQRATMLRGLERLIALGEPQLGNTPIAALVAELRNPAQPPAQVAVAAPASTPVGNTFVRVVRGTASTVTQGVISVLRWMLFGAPTALAFDPENELLRVYFENGSVVEVDCRAVVLERPTP